MGIVSDRYHNPVLGLGIIVYADPTENSYIIQPYDRATSRTSQLPATVPSASTDLRQSMESTAYAMGDSVIYVGVSDETWGDTPLLVALILGSIPVKSIGLITDYVREKGGPAEYYDAVGKLLDRSSEQLAAFATGKFVNNKIPGDYVREGKNTLFRVSSDVLETHAGNCAEILNGVDGNKISVAVTEDKSTVAKTTKEYVVNDSTLTVEKKFLSSVEKYDKNTPRYPDRLKLTGDLVYGEVEATLGGDNKPIAITEKRSDGCEIHRAVSGAVFEQTSFLKISYPTYKENLVYDENIKQPPDGYREAFDRVSDSWRWKELMRYDDDTLLRLPGDLVEGSDVERIADSENAKTVPTHIGRATFGFLPSGGFLIRDAWGSEIRMENGDIQLSAARNLIRIAGEDSLGICSGVLSETAESGIALGATAGNIDLYAGKNINLSTKEKLALASHGDVMMMGEVSTVIGGKSGKLLLQGHDCAVKSRNELTLSAEYVRAFGASEAMIASTSAVVRCRGDLAIAGQTINAYGNISVTNSKFEPGKINGNTISVGAGGGSIQLAGTLYSKGIIRGDDQIQAYKSVVGKQIIAQDVAPQIGVYKTTSPIQPLNRTFSGPENSQANLDSATSELVKKSWDTGVKELLSSMFGLLSTGVKIIKPLFSGKASNNMTISEAPSIVTESGTRYIYPGEAFWQRNGCITINNAGSADTIRDERSGGTEESGVLTVQLHQRKESKND